MRFAKILTTVFVLLAVSISSGWAANYPSKPIEFVVHVSAGGGSDIFTRMIVEIINQEKLCSQPITVSNRPGGGAALQLNYIAERNDPHILGIYAMASHLSAFMKAKIQGKFEEYVPVAQFLHESNVLAINTEAPYKDLKGLVAEAKKNPKKLTAGFGSIGGTGHVLAFMFAKAAGIELNYLAHKSGSEAVIGLLAGRLQLVTENPSEMLQHVRAGKLKIVGNPTERRNPDLPDVPTLKELGYDVVFGSARGAFAFNPPEEVRTYWAGVFKKVFETERFQNFMKENMMDPEFMPSTQAANFLNGKYKLVLPVAEEMGLTKK